MGRSFPHYLRETQTVDTRDADGSPSWPDFLIDLVTVERTYSEVFDGPGIEGKRILQADDLTVIPPERWPDARLVPVPCLRLLSLQFPVHEYISAVRRRAEATLPQPSPTHLVVTRRDYVVRRSAVSRAEYDLLSALVAGESIGDAITLVAFAPDVDVEALADELQQWFRSWAAAGYFQAVEWSR